MLESVSGNGHSFEFCKETLKKSTLLCPLASSEGEFDGIQPPPRTDIVLDAGFKDFYRYCKGHDVPIVIISRYAEAPLRSPTPIFVYPSNLSPSFFSAVSPSECPWS